MLREKSGRCSATQSPVVVGSRGPGSHIHVHVALITSASASSHPTAACNDHQDIPDGEGDELPHSGLHQALKPNAGFVLGIAQGSGSFASLPPLLWSGSRIGNKEPWAFPTWTLVPQSQVRQQLKQKSRADGSIIWELSPPFCAGTPARAESTKGATKGLLQWRNRDGLSLHKCSKHCAGLCTHNFYTLISSQSCS